MILQCEFETIGLNNNSYKSDGFPAISRCYIYSWITLNARYRIREMIQNSIQCLRRHNAFSITPDQLSQDFNKKCMELKKVCLHCQYTHFIPRPFPCTPILPASPPFNLVRFFLFFLHLLVNYPCTAKMMTVLTSRRRKICTL